MSTGQGGMTGWASAVVVGSLTAVVLTADRLPARVASHFGPDGRANGFMDRTLYLVVLIGALIVLPTFAAIAIGQSARNTPSRLKLPNADYWLDPARRDESARFIGVHFGWFAAAVSLLAVAVHLLVIEANQLTPPSLAAGAFMGVLLAFTALVVVWIHAFQRRFRRP
jgi:uncharacterized membrane protein